MIGPLISRHPLNQSEAIAKPLVTWSLAFFYAQGTVHIFYFEFSLAPDSSFALIDRCDFFGFLFIFKIVKRHRAFRIWRSKNLYIIIILYIILLLYLVLILRHPGRIQRRKHETKENKDGRR